MASITEMVEDEALRAEQEPEPEPGEPEPGEPEPEPELEPTPPQAEAAPVDVKALEREMKRHEREMVKVLGDGWQDMKPCDTCGSVGYVPSDFEPPPEMKDDPFAVPCPSCNGYGLLLTHSLREGNQTTPCDKCSGAGWRDKRQIQAEQDVAAYTPPPPVQPPPPELVWDAAMQSWRTTDGQLVSGG